MSGRCTKHLGVGALLMALAIPACRRPAVADTAADRAAVDAALEQYRQAWLQGDTAMALRQVSGNVRFLFPGERDLDSAAVHGLVIDEMAKYTIPSLTLTRADFFVAGDHAVDIGTYEEIQLPKTGAPIHGIGRYTTVWRREPGGGGWRIWRFMINELPAK
jgi:ketosteroid isomerase-like protein